VSQQSKIEWTDTTWNPVTKVADRFWKGRKFTDVQFHADRLDQPLRWRKPRRVFVNSMSDLFHYDVPDDFIDRVFAVMALAPQHTFQVLTKRPERMRRYMARQVVGQADGFTYGDRIAVVACGVLRALPVRLANAVARRTGLLRPKWPPPNVWLGVSVEDQSAADERIPLLLQAPAAVRFLSCEPLLGPVDLRRVSTGMCLGLPMADGSRWLGSKPGIDWVIVGGESGPGARPCDVAWIRSIVEQCQVAGVPVFVKQLGAVPVCVDGDSIWDRFQLGVRHPKGGDPDEWPEDLRVREFPQ
jgi:protein gp37